MYYYINMRIKKIFHFFSHEKALEAMTMKGEAENKSRFSAVITALKGDNYPATLKVLFHQNFIFSYFGHFLLF